MSKLKLEVGKSYRTREGHKAIFLEEIENKNYPMTVAIKGGGWKGWFIEYLTSDGRRHGDGSKSRYDIVEEWVEPLDFDWGCLPAWCDKAIAMNGDGNWYSYPSKHSMKIYKFYWKPYADICSVPIPPKYAPKNFNGSWEDSLFVNPKYQDQ